MRFAKVRADDDLEATAAFCIRAFAAAFFLVWDIDLDFGAIRGSIEELDHKSK